GIDLLDPQPSALGVRARGYAQSVRARKERSHRLVEAVDDGALARVRDRRRVLRGDRRLARPRGPEEERPRPRTAPPAGGRVERRVAAPDPRGGGGGPVLGRDEAGEDLEAAAVDGEIVEAVAEGHAAQ